MRSWNPGGNGRWKESQPQQFSRDARLRPLRMLMPDPLLGEFPGEQAHLQRQQDALFSRHCPLNFKLDSLRRRAGVGVGHGVNVTTGFSLTSSRGKALAFLAWVAPDPSISQVNAASSLGALTSR